MDLRVAKVGYRLSIANTALCPGARAPQAGFVLHSIQQYDAADHESVMRSFGLSSDVGVMAVVAGSPAQLSGLSANDQLISVNSRALGAAAAADASPTRAPVEFAQRILAEEMAKGEVVLRLSRADGYHDVRFTAESGCASGVELLTGGEANAWTDGQRVVIGDGILAHCRTDGALALVIGHELAHNLLRHGHRREADGSAAERLRLTGPGSPAMQEKEEEADRLAVQMASAAAYDLSDALPFVTALLEADSEGRATGTHPAPARRLALLKAEIAAADAARVLSR
jgi:beta-barrel assembly-enhancing protease